MPKGVSPKSLQALKEHRNLEGRPVLPPEQRKLKFQITMDPQVFAALNGATKNRSAFIEALVREKLETA